MTRPRSPLTPRQLSSVLAITARGEMLCRSCGGWVSAGGRYFVVGRSRYGWCSCCVERAKRLRTADAAQGRLF
jgi:hypothetical protein